jgi:hypothetical protein
MSNQNSINSQEVLKSFRSNHKERFWKEKIIALAVIFLLGLIIYFIFFRNKTKDFTSRFQGNIASKTNLILYLSAKDGDLNGYFYDFCDSLKKINIKGTLDKNGKFVLDELEVNNPNSPSLKGTIGEDGSLSGERIENYGNTKLSFYFSRITSLPLIACQDIANSNPSLKVKNDPVAVQNIPQQKRLIVNGKNLTDLRSKLDKQSKKLMENLNYQPENSNLDISNFTFSCDLIPNTSANFSKIGLFFGPKSNGYCESCSNVLSKNSGSKELFKDEDNDYFYSIIALPR